jgi:hypothetical protein
MSKCAKWLVSSFSLESKTTSPVADVSARPKFVAGVLTHPCTSDVTSTTTNCSVDAGVNEAVAEPKAGMEL